MSTSAASPPPPPPPPDRWEDYGISPEYELPAWKEYIFCTPIDYQFWNGRVRNNPIIVHRLARARMLPYMLPGMLPWAILLILNLVITLRDIRSGGFLLLGTVFLELFLLLLILPVYTLITSVPLLRVLQERLTIEELLLTGLQREAIVQSLVAGILVPLKLGLKLFIVGNLLFLIGSFSRAGGFIGTGEGIFSLIIAGLLAYIVASAVTIGMEYFTFASVRAVLHVKSGRKILKMLFRDWFVSRYGAMLFLRAIGALIFLYVCTCIAIFVIGGMISRHFTAAQQMFESMMMDCKLPGPNLWWFMRFDEDLAPDATEPWDSFLLRARLAEEKAMKQAIAAGKQLEQQE